MTGLPPGPPLPASRLSGTEQAPRIREFWVELEGPGHRLERPRSAEVSKGWGCPPRSTRRTPRLPRGLECWPSFPIADLGAQSRAGWAKILPTLPTQGHPRTSGLVLPSLLGEEPEP